MERLNREVRRRTRVVGAWEKQRNAATRKVNCQFTLRVAALRAFLHHVNAA